MDSSEDLKPTTSSEPISHESIPHRSDQVHIGSAHREEMGSVSGPDAEQAQKPAAASGNITDISMQRINKTIEALRGAFHARVVGQDMLGESLLITLIAGGHILLESVPGLAKSTAAHTLAQAVQGSYHRIQCTPDLMPNDIVGTQIYNMATGEMTTQLGPVHANFVLLDEINRSSAKTQSAMLEAMQERQTSIGGKIYPVPQPFMVMATQNPIEEEGTYVLPEAQMDRFLLKEVLSYPAPKDELSIIDNTLSGAYNDNITPDPVATLDDVRFLQEQRRLVYIHPAIRAYIVDIVNTTRGSGPAPISGWSTRVRVGASPRASLALAICAQALALIRGRKHVIPDDVHDVRYRVLRHRIIRTYDALADDVNVETLIDTAFQQVVVP